MTNNKILRWNMRNILIWAVFFHSKENKHLLTIPHLCCEFTLEQLKFSLGIISILEYYLFQEKPIDFFFLPKCPKKIFEWSHSYNTYNQFDHFLNLTVNCDLKMLHL